MKKKSDGVSLKEDDDSKKLDKKAFFIQRLIAFVVDILLISLVATLLTSSFIKSEKNDKYNEQLGTIMEKFQAQEIDMDEYLLEYSSLYYKMARNNGILSIVTIFLSVLYFVVYQVYTNGQTFGKKLMKIRVVSENGDLFYNQMIFRSFLANFILVDLLSFVLMLLSPSNIYFYCVGILQLIQYLIVFISIIMVMNRKDGAAIHDKIVHTLVVQEK